MAQAAKWWNDGVWKDHFIPTANQVTSDLLSGGNEFGSGNVAIDEGHTWFTCCVTPAAPKKPFKFGFAVQPTVNGKITSPLHADTFSVLKTTKVPDAAFKALQAIVASGDLLTAYGAMPADQTKQQAWFDSIDAQFPGMKLDWDVAKQMLAYPDIPNHQSYVPDYSEGPQRHAGVRERLSDDPGTGHGCRAGQAPGDPAGHLRRRDSVAAVRSGDHPTPSSHRPEGV